ncbi:hypothetical protein [Flavobacterium coralii]|uniref:hypothetical protein n=1 Tax=Flavobacterium coralii TaxID=2838017 RepID=UPI000C4DA0F0|nr:hypothetical protein [Flavobacterium sp.]|tara:strand:+ start:1494 stop:2456 length:963 start_codon:yes stop_codon:yes gene_type:complete
MTNQDKLIRIIRNQIPQNASVIDEVAAILNISYDAAHRRISLKSKFSIEETVALCKHFSLSMDLLFTDSKKVIVEKTKEIQSEADMEAYFMESAKRLEYFKNTEGAKMYYSAKDIPLFHTIGGTLLSKFKMYVWLNLLRGSQTDNTFENFTLSRSLLEHSTKLKAVYESAEVHEIWNDTTINSTLQQIYYYFQAGLLSLQNAELLCADLEKVLTEVEHKCNAESANYCLYYNELLILNNNVLITAPDKQALFVPYTMLGYFITSDKETCTNAKDFFRHQIRNSKSLNQSGTRDRKIFFNRARQKTAHYLLRMQEETHTGL